MNDVEWLKIKTECSINQARGKGLAISASGYGLKIDRNGSWGIHLLHVWPTSMLILGRKGRSGNEMSCIHEVLGIDDIEVIRRFNEGFAGFAYSKLPTKDEWEAYLYGIGLRRRLLGAK